jgi:4-hydroxy-tetrahydrodipicolinate reductase
MIQCALAGASGRMGRAIINVMSSDAFSKDITLSGSLASQGSFWLDVDAGVMSGLKGNGVIVSDDPVKAFKDAQVIIDFSGPDATMRNLENAKKAGIPVVIGTTGFTEDQKIIIKKYSESIPILLTPNMSVGVNVLFHLTEIAAKLMSDSFDMEITEAHHKHKKDAPSGTALKLKEILLESLGRSEDDVVYGRHGITGERPQKEIAVHALRGGDVVGDHTVFFLGDGERVELTHKAGSRNTFATGAVRSAMFLYNRKPGFYSMKDVLGI